MKQSINGIKSLFHVIRIVIFSKFFTDSPSLPASLGTFTKDSLLDHPQSYPLAKLLEFGNPELYYRWRWQVLPAAYAVKHLADEVKSLKKEQEKLTAKVKSLQARFDSQPHTNHNPDDDFIPRELPTQPTSSLGSHVLTIGLSLMILLGLSQFLGIDLQGFTLEQLPGFLLAIAGAVCINIGEKIGVADFVEVARRYEPQRTYQDDEDHPNQIAWWERLRSGDPAVWNSLILIFLETLFAFPGLISFFPLRLQVNLIFQLTALAAAGLAATVNILMAWGYALKKVQWQQQCEKIRDQIRQDIEARLQDQSYLEQRNIFLNKEEELARTRQKIAKRLGEAKGEYQSREQVILDLNEKLSVLERKATLEYARWEHRVRCWIEKNPDKLENFHKIYPMWQAENHVPKIDSNGHHLTNEAKFELAEIDDDFYQDSSSSP